MLLYEFSLTCQAERSITSHLGFSRNSSENVFFNLLLLQVKCWIPAKMTYSLYAYGASTQVILLNVSNPQDCALNDTCLTLLALFFLSGWDNFIILVNLVVFEDLIGKKQDIKRTSS